MNKKIPFFFLLCFSFLPSFIDVNTRLLNAKYDITTRLSITIGMKKKRPSQHTHNNGKKNGNSSSILF